MSLDEVLNQRAARTPLSREEVSRYSRHLLLAEVGEQGQKKLKAARVLVVGAGGLGSPVLYYLAAAGVGTIGVVEHDQVDISNLQRQILYITGEVGKPKIDAATQRISELSPNTELILFRERLSAQNAKAIISQFDLIIDGTDNFPTRYLINDACVLLNKPNIYGSVFRFDGQAAVFFPPHGPCYRCLFPQPPAAEAAPNCTEAGVLGVLPGVIGLIQATEALKLCLGIGDSLIGKLLLYDALTMRFDTCTLNRDPQCAICGTAPTITELVEIADTCDRSATAKGQSIRPDQVALLSKDHLLLDVRAPEEVAICAIPGSRNIPLNGLLNGRWQELNSTQETVVYCKSGSRSQRAQEFLLAKGFSKVLNLEGGILAWIKKCAPNQTLY